MSFNETVDLLDKLGMIDGQVPVNTFDDLPMLMNFVRELCIQNEQEIVNQLLVCLLYKGEKKQ